MNRSRWILALAAAVALAFTTTINSASNGGAAPGQPPDQAAQSDDCAGVDVHPDDRRFWDEMRYAQEIGYGKTPAPLPNQDQKPDQAHTGRVDASAKQISERTPEGRAHAARNSLVEDHVDKLRGSRSRYSSEDDYLMSFPKLRRGLDNWSACMSQHGYSFASPGEATGYVQSQVAALGELPPIPLVIGDGHQTEEDLAIQAFWEELGPELDELRSEEVAIATRDHECRQSELYPAIIKQAGK